MSEDAPLPEGIVQPVQLSDDVLEKIADILSVDTSEIHYISYDNIAPAEDPSQAMKDYVQSDGHQIIGKLGVISVDTQGVYVVKVILTDELFERLKGQNVADFKLYALSDAADAAGIDSSFLLGFINTWEILTLGGEKMETFGVREFLMTGVLNAGTPFSVYIAKILLMLLAGGCTSGIGFIPGILTIAFIPLLFLRKR